MGNFIIAVRRYFEPTAFGVVALAVTLAAGGLIAHDARRPVCLPQVFHPGRDVERPDAREREPAIFAPGKANRTG